MSTLGEILSGAPLTGAVPPEIASARVRGVAYDSRKVGAGFLFFAFPGKRADGGAFAGQALERGALAVVSESPRPADFAGSWIQVQHGRRALAVAARNFFGKPDERLVDHGHHRHQRQDHHRLPAGFDSARRRAHHRAGGTIEYRLAGKATAAVNTTPESPELFRLFSELLAAGGTHATMEVSSHALALGRVYGIRFHTAVFTNLTRDHLDFHDTMEEYFAAKRLLFEGAGAPPPPFAVINHDDAFGAPDQDRAGQRKTLATASGRAPTCAPCHIHSGFDGLHFEILLGKQRFPIGLAASRPHERLQHPGRVVRGAQPGHRAGSAGRRHRRAAARCRDASSASTRGSRFWWSWITRTPTTPCGT